MNIFDELEKSKNPEFLDWDSLDDSSFFTRLEDELARKEACIKRITDNKVLAYIAMTANFPHLSWLAIDKITDEKMLYYVVMNCKVYLSNVTEGLAKIKNEDLLKDIVSNHPATHIQALAIKRIKDQKFLAITLVNNPDPLIKKYIIMNLDKMHLDILQMSEYDEGFKNLINQRIDFFDEKEKNSPSQ